MVDQRRGSTPGRTRRRSYSGLAWTCSRATRSRGRCTAASPRAKPDARVLPGSRLARVLRRLGPRGARRRRRAARASAGADLDDPRLTELVGELSLKSDAFRRLWARHDVRDKTTGAKRFIHPQVGELTLSYESFAASSAPGQLLTVYHAEPDTPSGQALALLSSLAAGEPSSSAPSRAPSGS